LAFHLPFLDPFHGDRRFEPLLWNLFVQMDNERHDKRESLIARTVSHLPDVVFGRNLVINVIAARCPARDRSNTWSGQQRGIFGHQAQPLTTVTLPRAKCFCEVDLRVVNNQCIRQRQDIDIYLLFRVRE
jgi:hypothetical protein